MRITFEYLAQLKRAVGTSRETLDLPDGSTLGLALRHLAQLHGVAFSQLVLDEAQKPNPSLLFFVGEEQADSDRPLQDGDVITILAPMAGGCP